MWYSSAVMNEVGSSQGTPSECTVAWLAIMHASCDKAAVLVTLHPGVLWKLCLTYAFPVMLAM